MRMRKGEGVRTGRQVDVKMAVVSVQVSFINYYNRLERQGTARCTRSFAILLIFQKRNIQKTRAKQQEKVTDSLTARSKSFTLREIF